MLQHTCSLFVHRTKASICFQFANISVHSGLSLFFFSIHLPFSSPHPLSEPGFADELQWFFSTAADRDVEINVKELLGEEDLQGNTVLHMAAWNNDVKTAQLCLEIGADVNTLKCNSASALHLAATKGNLEMADLLISRGAGVNTKDKDSKTPLQRWV